MEKKRKIGIEQLAVTAVMLAASTLLSLLKIIDLPYGGSVTMASLLPIVIVAIRYGTPWGLLTGLTHGLIQFALGASVLGWVTGWVSIVTVILLDYVVAFAVIGLAGLARKIKNQPAAFLLGSFIACLGRYICHFLSGVTVWRDISIPGDAAVIYSLIYNATYMLPELLVLLVVAYYISSALDFRAAKLVALRKTDLSLPAKILSIIAGAILAFAAVFDIVSIFSVLQNEETGEFAFTQLSEVNWPVVIAVTVICIVFAAAIFIAKHFINRNAAKKAQ